MQQILKKEYNYVIDQCVEYEGISFLGNNFEKYLQNKVKDRLKDTEWNEMLINAAVELTGFSKENFSEIFCSNEEENSWRIGEIVAECVLEDNYGSRFYYNSSRDAKNIRSNLTGADLVGFCELNGEVCFLFGEVKTSTDLRKPPQVLYGKTGMIKQLESLKCDGNKRNELVKWVFSKARLIKGEFLEDCKKAITSYIKSNKNKVHLIGVLIRDTIPDPKDLKSRAEALCHNVPQSMSIKLISIYTGLKMENNNWEKALNRGA